MTKRPPNPDSLIADFQEEFHCSAEWHLASLSKAASLIYNWSLRLSKKSRRFRVSPNQAAEYFKIASRTAQLGYEDLKKVGLFELVESGKASGEVSVHKPLTHKEWAAKNPGKCAERIEFAWTPENDLLGQELFNIADGRIQFKQFEVNRYRKFDLNDEAVIKYFRAWYPEHKKEQEARTLATGAKSRSWRKWVGYEFGECLKYLAHSFQEHPSERDLILENAFTGRAFLAHRRESAKRESLLPQDALAN